ncbi:MAG: polysaccharide pyruvyl transferase family protein [Planctomycetaceae bacterium]
MWLTRKSMPFSTQRALRMAINGDLGRPNDGLERRSMRSGEHARRLAATSIRSFSSSELRTEAKRLIEAATLVFARDRVSLHHVQELGPFDHVHLAPDFTNIVQGEPSCRRQPSAILCLRRPQHPHVGSRSGQDRGAYIGFLTKALRQAGQLGLEPVFLFHDEANDKKVADLVEAQLGRSVPRILESRPERLKGNHGRATVVIGSRFHALVGALSQAVPCIVTGWSHKYEMLLEDYGCPEFLVMPSGPTEELTHLLDLVMTAASRRSVTDTLQKHGDKLKQQVEEMFAMTSEAIGLAQVNADI